MKNKPLAQSINHQAVLHSLHASGPATYLELELRIGRAGMHRNVNYLQQLGFIKGQPKKRGLLRVYEITKAGMEAVGIDMPEAKTPGFKVTPYIPAYVPVRAGSMRAFSLPSRGIGA